MMYDAYHYKDEYYMLPVPPLVWFEHNPHGGIMGTIRSGHFKDFANISFIQPPICFDTHSMDNCGKWTLEVRQNRHDTRPRVKITNKEGFGFRFRLQAKRYADLSCVLNQFMLDYTIDKDPECGLYRTVPVLATATDHHVYKPLDITELLKQHNDTALEKLGNYRPADPDMTNVIKIEDYIESIGSNEEILRDEGIDIDSLIEKLA